MMNLNIPVPERTPAKLLLRRPAPAPDLRRMSPQPVLRVAGMSPYRPTRREFLIGAAGLLILAPYGCGGESEQGGETTASGTRTIDHALGETEVQMEPQRVVALGVSSAEVALELGIEPTATNDQNVTYPYLDLGSAESVGELGALNLEAIATTDPDLIYGLDLWIEEVYEDLSEIAPTVAVGWLGSSSEWKRHGREYAAALRGEEGRQRYDEMVSTYEQRAEEVGRRLQEARGEDFTVAIMRIQTGSPEFNLPGLFSGSVVYGDVGMLLPQGLREPAEEGEASLDVSLEELSRGDADVIFVYAGVGEDAREQSAEQIESLMGEPLFQNLQAAESGNIYPVGAHWFSGNIIAAPLILDDLERYLLGGESTGGGATS